MSNERVIFLDRDGVINQDRADFVKTPEEWQPISGSLAAIARLHVEGYKVVVITNQSGVGRGLLTRETLDAIHASMTQQIRSMGGELAGIFVCPHLPEEGCPCRKPAPGLIHEAERVLSIRASGAPFIGDRISDLIAARAAGCRPIFVRTRGAEIDARSPEFLDVPVYADLGAAVDALLAADETT